MLVLALAVAAFAAVHLVSVVPPAKERLSARLGAAYGPLYGAATLIALGLIVLGWRMSPFEPVYEPPEGGRYGTFVLVLIGFIGLGVFLCRGRMRQWLRFPLAIGTVAWAAGHLLSNGDLASLILFGGLGAYGLAHLALGVSYGLRPSSVVRPGHDTLSILAGFALFAVMAQAHETLIGVPVVVLVR